MKRRIMALFLAAVLVFNIGQTNAKAYAAVVSEGVVLAILAVNILGLMVGCYDDCAEAIDCIIEYGVEVWQKAFVGSEDCPSWFVSGWEQIYDFVCGSYENGDITTDGVGSFTLKYATYMEAVAIVAHSLPLDFTFVTDLQYYKVDALHKSTLSAGACPILPSSDSKYTSMQSYVPIWYNSTEIYFLDSYFYLSSKDYGSEDYQYIYASYYQYTSGFNHTTKKSLFGLPTEGTNAQMAFSLEIVGMRFSEFKLQLDYTFPIYLTTWYSDELSTLFKYDGAAFSQTDLSSIDTDTLSAGYLVVEGGFTDWLASIQGFTTAPSEEVDNLTDILDPILDITENPGLIIDTDPDVVDPVAATTVTDIPGSQDIPLSELMETPTTSIDVPSILYTKFPFCIPFDFIRILEVFCAEPIAPVIVIPISTDPASLEQFEGNQTIGEFPEDYVPLFEIDEEIVIDLSVIPLLQPICYTVFIIGFVILLIYNTPKMINH